ncbi:hypothetical protein D3C71_1486540 [compost metagenome]
MQHMHHVILRSGQHFNIQQRIALRQRVDRRQQAVAVDVRGNANRQGTLQPLRQFDSVVLQLLKLFGYQSRMGCQGQCQRGRRRLAVRTIKQLKPQFRLHIGDPHTHRRRYAAQRTGRGGKRTAIQYRQKQLNIVAGKIHCTSCQ